MKRILFILGLSVSMLTLGVAQMSVRTETTSNLYKYYSAATTGDTLYTTAAQVNGGGVDYVSQQGGSVVGILIGEPVASDTTILKNGEGTIATIVQLASGAVPAYYPIPARADTSLIFIQKKASKTTLIFRIKY